MKKVLIRCFMVGAIVAGMLLPAGAAHAAGAGVCQVQGTVLLGDPLNQSSRASTYTFTDTTLECTGTADINGVWNVTASGDTKGIATAGENCAQGASDGAGSISGTSSGGRGLSGSVNFERVGSIVVAYGSLVSSPAGKAYTWAGVFQFTPQPPTDLTLCTSSGPDGINQAALVGAAAVATAQ